MPVVYPIYSLDYRRPDYVPSTPRSRGSDGSIKSDITGSGTSLKTMPSNPRGVPEALSFDRIVNGGCCPPLTKREFLNYLKYQERSAENLQFFLWYIDYSKRFEEASVSEKVLAPVWTEALAEAERKEYRQQVKARTKQNTVATEMFKDSDFEEKAVVTESVDITNQPTIDEISSKSSEEPRGVTSSDSKDRPVSSVTGMKSFVSNYSQKADSAFEENGLSRPFTVQPFREEISRIIATYIAKGAPRELNLSGREHQALLKALEYTTHPTAFREVINNVEFTLRTQAHPNFVRYAICNGNRPRVIFARGLGVFLIVAGIVTDILLTLSSAGRGWRVLPLVLLVLGVSTLIAAWKGMCVVLHGLHHRHIRPWELFLDEDEMPPKTSDEYNRRTSIGIESLKSNSSNSWEDEPWVEKYKKRNIIRKVFDREALIEEPALKQIQDTIFVQSLLGALVVGGIIVGIFVAVPGGHLM